MPFVNFFTPELAQILKKSNLLSAKLVDEITNEHAVMDEYVHAINEHWHRGYHTGKDVGVKTTLDKFSAN